MGITEIAKQRIYDDLLMENMYSTPDEVLEYLRNNDNFRSLSSLIKETMVKSGVCDIDSDDSVYKKVLTDLLFQTEKECNESVDRDSIRKRVSRWINGNTVSIDKFENAIEICFALNLDLQKTNDFLHKAGFCSLSVRRADHAIYFYCILQNERGTKKTFADAQRLIHRYNSESYNDIGSDDDVKFDNNPDGTTLVLLDKMKECNWETDDAFINTYMLCNKRRFTSYSKHALFEYYKAKDFLFVTSLLYNIRNIESTYIADAEVLYDQNKRVRISNNECPIQFALRSALCKHNDDEITADAYSFLYKLNKSLRYKNISSSDIYNDRSTFSNIQNETYNCLLQIKKYLYKLDYSLENINNLEIISDFLLDISSPMDLFKSTIHVLVKNGEMRSLGNMDAIKGTLIDEYSFSDYEKDHSVKSDRSLIVSNRKMIILIFYLLFSFDIYKKRYENKTIESDCDDISLFANLTFFDFIDRVNEVLKVSSLSEIYLPNQFDCMIIMSIRKFETSNNVDEYEDSPFDFVNSILGLILNDTTNYWHRETWKASWDESTDDWESDDLFKNEETFRQRLDKTLDDWKSAL